MTPGFGKAAVVAACLAMIAIRAPHGQRSRTVTVVESRKGRLEVALLLLAWLGFLVPLVWIVSPLFAFADYPLHPAAFTIGCALLATGLWLFYRSHAYLGTNWSITLEVREHHRLVTGGVYRRVRHPMYSALFVYALGQMLALPNWIAGPSYLAAFGILYLLRVGREERMMLDAFGADYEQYARSTNRLIPRMRS